MIEAVIAVVSFVLGGYFYSKIVSTVNRELGYVKADVQELFARSVNQANKTAALKSTVEAHIASTTTPAAKA